MEVVNERCCGLDVHKQTVVACVIVPGKGREPLKEIRTFGTMTPELLEFADWLNTYGVTHVAMESTGVYWKPVWNLLEGQFQLLLVNARHVKQVPGRKTDVKDCEWLADLLRHGLLRASFVPDRPQRELRELTGILVDSEADLVPALDAVRMLDRSACRAAVEGRFSVQRMVAEHVAFYEQVIADRRVREESA